MGKLSDAVEAGSVPERIPGPECRLSNLYRTQDAENQAEISEALTAKSHGSYVFTNRRIELLLQEAYDIYVSQQQVGRHRRGLCHNCNTLNPDMLGALWVN